MRGVLVGPLLADEIGYYSDDGEIATTAIGRAHGAVSRFWSGVGVAATVPDWPLAGALVARLRLV